MFLSGGAVRPERASARFQKTKAMWEHAATRFPHAFNSATNMDFAKQIEFARELAGSGQYEKAANVCREITARQPHSHEAWHLLGVLHNLGGHPQDARDCIRRAIDIEPGIAKYHVNLGNACLSLNEPPAARAEYERALELDADFQDAHYNLGLLLLAAGDRGKGEFHLRRAVGGTVPLPEAWARLADTQETDNRLEDAAYSVAQGLALAPDAPLLRIVEAKLLRRGGRHAEALTRLSELSRVRLTARLAVGYHHEMGLLHELLGQSGLAFEHFSLANQAQSEDPAVKTLNPANYLAAVEQLADTPLGDSWLATDVADDEPAPVFLIGFPRSGTTLLDQILDSHPAIQTLEEKPLILTLSNEYENLAAETAPDREARRRMQARYFDLVAEHLALKPGMTLVDKFPLNIIRVPLIVRIFPKARFILALRHPLDVCLSCFMHPFGPNEAMLNFAHLDTTAQLYRHAMRLWLRVERELGLTAHRIRYEDLVRNFDAEVQGLLAFLGLPWDERVRDFARHAAERGKINTPSYHQVTRPLNRDAVYRWKRYAKQLAPIVPVLAPFIREYAYDVEFADQA